MEKLTSSSTRDDGAGTNKFNPTSSFVSEWMLNPDVVFFHGITEVFSYFQDNYFSARDEYDKARNTVLVLLRKSLNRGQFFLIVFLRKKYTSVLAQLRKNYFNKPTEHALFPCILNKPRYFCFAKETSR